ncbi:histidine kinase [Nonlabens arenilitoris]|uniref:Histidine kinase n=1 Tax=Nonlabens arenilitoris TaxID=1217969 RepID=A0A2S7U9R2_9FLAO|nr:Hpt domain-containing protein [Nonlabens arenilitoris]PQJ31629.1 histidine kinase [Nonlabens arenilitoris]
MELPNRSYIDSLCRGDKVFEKRLLSVIKAEFPVEKDIYYKALAVKNIEEIAEAVHKLKHKISILGLEKGYALAAQYENDIRDDKFDLAQSFEEILDSMTEYLKTL